MFEIRCIVGDKKLSDALRALKGHTIEHPVVLPVDDKVMSAAQLDAAEQPTQTPKPVTTKHTKMWKRRRKEFQHGGRHLKGKGSTAVVRELIEKSGATHITAREMKRATIAAGYSPGAYSHAIKLLVAGKWLKALDDKGNYVVTRPTAQPVAHTATPAYEAIQHG